MSGWLPVETVTKPAGVPLPIGVVRAWVNVTDDSEDALLTLLAQAAVAHAEDHAGIRLFTQTVRMRRRCFDACMRLPIGPIQSITTIEYLDESGATATLDPAVYDFAGGAALRPKLNLADGQSWPTLYRAAGAVTVTAVAGFGGINDQRPNIRIALAKMVAAWFDNRAEGDIPADALRILDMYRMPVL